MARSYGVLKPSLWEPGSDFRQLTLEQQWTYEMLISQPQINNLGMVAYTPERWARLAVGLTAATVADLILALARANYVLVDFDTGELLVRTFVKHDKVWAQPKLVKNARGLIAHVESYEIRDYLTTRHPWLLEPVWTAGFPPDTPIQHRRNATVCRCVACIDRDLIEQHETLERGSETPNDTPPTKPLSEGVSTPRAHATPTRAGAGAGPGAGVGVGPSSSKSKASRTASYEPAATSVNGNSDQTNAAADPEPPPEQRIREIATTYGADLDIVEREAQQLPAPLFEDVATRLTNHINAGTATNPPGLLIDLLKRARREHLHRQATETAAHTNDWTLEEELDRDARSYARGQHPWPIAHDLITRKLTRHGTSTAQQEQLLLLASVAYEGELAGVRGRGSARERSTT